MLFAHRPQPSLRTVLGEAQRYMLALLMERMGGRYMAVAAATDLPPQAVRSCLGHDLPLPDTECVVVGLEPRAIRTPRPARFIIRRAVNLAELAGLFRQVFQLSADEPGAGAAIAMRHRAQNEAPVFAEVDANGLLAWIVSGVYLFSGGMPTMEDFRSEAKRVAVGLAMTRGRSITGAATLLRISRKTLRDNMQALGVYPWDERDGGE